MPSLHSNRGAKRAREARAALTDDPLAPVPCLLTVVEERAGLPVVVTTLPDQIAGACYRDDGGAVVWVNGAHGHARQRFTLAHELGHAWCRHDVQLEVDTFMTLSGNTTSPIEVQANAFAAEFLVPAAALTREMSRRPTLDDVVAAATRFGVSAIMFVYRLKHLEIASPQHVERLEDEIAEDLHVEAYERLGLAPLDDRLGGLERLPYLSPALRDTRLGAALRSEAAVDRDTGAAIDRLLGSEA